MSKPNQDDLQFTTSSITGMRVSTINNMMPSIRNKLPGEVIPGIPSVESYESQNSSIKSNSHSLENHSNPKIIFNPNEHHQGIPNQPINPPPYQGNYRPAVVNPNIPNQNIPIPNFPNPNIHNQNIPIPNFPNPNIPSKNFPNPNIPNKNIPNPNIPNPNIPNKNIPNPNIPIPNFPNPNIPNQNIPNQNIPNKNLPNPNIPNPNIPNLNNFPKFNPANMPPISGQINPVGVSRPGQLSP